MIILGIADAHSFMEGKAKFTWRIVQPSRLIDAGRKYHYGLLIEGDEQFQPRILHCLEYSSLMRQPRRDGHPTDLDRFHTKAGQTLNKLCRRRFAEECFLSRARRVDHGTIFRHDIIKEFDLGKNR